MTEPLGHSGRSQVTQDRLDFLVCVLLSVVLVAALIGSEILLLDVTG
jgi:hypothetical protein